MLNIDINKLYTDGKHTGFIVGCCYDDGAAVFMELVDEEGDSTDKYVLLDAGRITEVKTRD